MRIARESPIVAFTTFALHIAQNKSGFFCFFEGKDSGYYVPRIKIHYSGNYFPIRCESKKNVIKVFTLIGAHPEYQEYKIGYFVDRDFNTPLDIASIYETPCYSIENFYTSSEVFGEILKSELGITEIENSFIKCLELYKNLQESFHDSVALFNAWYACYIEKCILLNSAREVKLGSKLPSEFIKISLQGIEKFYDLNSIKEKYPVTIPIDDEEITKRMELHKYENRGLIFRGKFELNFMLTILTELINDSNKNRDYITTPINYGINNNLAISHFSQYAITPSCLNTYINSITKQS